MTDELDQISEEIKSCQRCELRQNASRPVPGHGEVGAKYFLIGEAPGKSEDEAGVPFVGMSGRRLDKLLALAGIDINDCYLSNVCRCRPPTNRNRRKGEIKACVEFLWREIKLVKPQYLMTLGSVPLGLFCPYGVRQTHGTQVEVEVKGQKFTLLSMYHPAAALHQPRLWADLLDDFENLPEKVPSDFSIAPDGLIKYGLNLASMPLASMDTEQDGSGGLGQWSIAYRCEGKLAVAPFFGTRKDVEWQECPIAMHNAKYDLRVLQANKMHEPEEIHDTMIMAYCLGLGKQAPKDSTKSRSGSDMVGGLGLKYLARRHLGMEMKRWDEVKDSPDDIPEYNAKDSVATFLLAEKWLPILPKHYFEIDMPLLRVLMAMEDRGVQIDPTYLETYAKDLDNRLADFDLPLNTHATQEVQSYVYGTLGVEPWRFTESGAPSVEAEVLETIKDPLVEQILRYKELYKDRGTYVESYVKLRDHNDRIHPELKQVSTSTGRLSCARPNLQNVDKEGDMRKLIVAAEGKKLVRLDWQRMELWGFAALGHEPKMLDALISGRDPHQETADFLGIPRLEGRNVNFLMLYSGGAWKISQEFSVPIGQAKEMIKKYYEMYPGIKKYHEMMTEVVKSEKKVTNFFGRTRRVDAMYVEQWRIQQEGIKEAINMPIQGVCAEIAKLAMIDLHYNHSAPMVLQVHDEILFELPEKEAVEYAQWLKEYVPNITKINDVALPVDVSVGRDWKECGG